jgi:thioesterase domain-containing protein
MPLGRFLAQSTAPDQPLFIINVEGINGRGATPSSVKEMALKYVDEIIRTEPIDRLLVAGMCAGGLAALEVARVLIARGRKVGPVILADPPPAQVLMQQHRLADHRDPQVAAQLYQRARGELLDHASQSHMDMPFSVNDQEQVHIATQAAVKTSVAFCTHAPETFPHPIVAILSFERAAGFFHPQMLWVRLLPRRLMVHVLPYTHAEIFRSGVHDFACVLNFVLEQAMNSGVAEERAMKSAVTSA